MGSGKTLGATSLMVNHRSTYNLIVSVNTNIQYWVEQVRMTPFITREAVTEGGEAETMVSRFGSSERDIVLWFEVVGYTAFRSDLDNARALEMYNVVCLDEAHYFRNNTQGMKFAIDAIHSAKNVILLTGTPLVNDQEDIVGTLKLADCDGVRDWEGEYAATGILPTPEQVTAFMKNSVSYFDPKIHRPNMFRSTTLAWRISYKWLK